MLKIRALLAIIVVITIVGVMSVPAQIVQAAGEQWLIQERISSGCNSGETGFRVQFVNLTAGATYYADTIVKDWSGVVYMDEYFSAVAPGPFDNDWYVFNTNHRGLRTGTWPMPAGTPLIMTVTLRDAAQNELYTSTAGFTCDGDSFSDPTVPGCDALIDIPEGSVGGRFVADAPVYWKPGELTNPLVTIKAGNTARVTRMDASKTYYEIIWQCQFLWVPAHTLAPNPDAVWRGAPLPARTNAYTTAGQGVSAPTGGGVVSGSAAGYPVYSAPKTASTYTVQRGDNLFRIAIHFGVDLYRLASVNGITDVQRIYAGQVLNIAAAR